MKEGEKNEKWLNKIPVLKKIKNIKHFEIIIALIFVAILLLIYFNGFSFGGSSSSSTTVNYALGNNEQFVENLENKLKNVLSNIEGAGNVNVMVSLSSGYEIVIAKSEEEKTTTTQNSNGTSSSVTVVTDPIIIEQNGVRQPIILMEVLPKIKGIIVVSSGADNVKVKLDLLTAVQALVEISTENIQIFNGI